MATLTLFCNDDAFNNNISGFYNGETFVVVSSTSSSDAIQNDGLWRFPAAGLAAGDTITSVVLYFYCTANNDGMGVASYVWYCDVNDVWGTLDASDPPNTSISSGTQVVGADGSFSYTAGAWNSHVFNTVAGFPKNAAFNVGCSAALGDVGPANLDIDAIENTNTRSPYPAGTGHTDGRVFLVITYTPASTFSGSTTRMMSGMGI